MYRQSKQHFKKNRLNNNLKNYNYTPEMIKNYQYFIFPTEYHEIGCCKLYLKLCFTRGRIDKAVFITFKLLLTIKPNICSKNNKTLRSILLFDQYLYYRQKKILKCLKT